MLPRLLHQRDDCFDNGCRQRWAQRLRQQVVENSSGYAKQSIVDKKKKKKKYAKQEGKQHAERMMGKI